MIQPIMDVIITTRNTPIFKSLKSSLIIPYFYCKVNSFDSSPVDPAAGIRFFRCILILLYPAQVPTKASFTIKK